MCRVKEGLSRSEQLVRYFYSVPALGVAYCLAKPRLALTQHQQEDLPHLFALAHVSEANRHQQWPQFIEDSVEPSFHARD